MHVAYLTGDYSHQDEPWYLNIYHLSWKGANIYRDHSLGISLVSVDCWKGWANTGPNSLASSFMTLGWSSPGPKALEGFKPLRSLVTPSLETKISSMKGTDLSRSGTWVCSFLLNTSVNWPLNSSAFSRSDCATPFPFLLFRDGIPWVSFFWLLMYQ